MTRTASLDEIAANGRAWECPNKLLDPGHLAREGHFDPQNIELIAQSDAGREFARLALPVLKEICKHPKVVKMLQRQGKSMGLSAPAAALAVIVYVLKPDEPARVTPETVTRWEIASEMLRHNIGTKQFNWHALAVYFNKILPGAQINNKAVQVAVQLLQQLFDKACDSDGTPDPEPPPSGGPRSRRDHRHSSSSPSGSFRDTHMNSKNEQELWHQLEHALAVLFTEIHSSDASERATEQDASVSNGLVLPRLAKSASELSTATQTVSGVDSAQGLTSHRTSLQIKGPPRRLASRSTLAVLASAAAVLVAVLWIHSLISAPGQVAVDERIALGNPQAPNETNLTATASAPLEANLGPQSQGPRIPLLSQSKLDSWYRAFLLEEYRKALSGELAQDSSPPYPRTPASALPNPDLNQDSESPTASWHVLPDGSLLFLVQLRKLLEPGSFVTLDTCGHSISSQPGGHVCIRFEDIGNPRELEVLRMEIAADHGTALEPEWSRAMKSGEEITVYVDARTSRLRLRANAPEVLATLVDRDREAFILIAVRARHD